MINIANNISSLTSPTLISGAKSQLTSQAKDKVKQTILTKADELKNKSQELAKRRIDIEVEYKKLFQSVQDNSSLSSEEKSKAIDDLQQKRINEINLIDEEIKNIEKDITDSNKDVLKSFKNKKKKTNNSINKNIKSARKNQVKANALRIKQVLKNGQKTIAPIIISQITNILIRIVVQNSRLQELVDKTNEIIDNADTPEKINQARILRNNALTILNNQISRLEAIRNIINRLRNIITVIQIIITLIKIIFSIPKPFGPGPTMPTPIASKLNKLQALIDALGVALSVCSAILDQIISQIEDLKAQLRDINDILEGKASDIPQLNSTLNVLSGNFGTDFGTYKGFKFAIKEESGPKAIVVRGNKRHYAEAIDTNNVAVLKSELSFTLDPNDLIDQLKLIIDSQNLIA